MEVPSCRAISTNCWPASECCRKRWRRSTGSAAVNGKRGAPSWPVIYIGWVPFLLMDLFVTVYQAVCFPVYGIPKVRRSDYLVFDREDLPYLNAIEKFNCFYCSYGNGVAAYAREVAARTEQYWCPIKHARRIRDAHGRYPKFFDHGDAEAFHQGLARLRRQYRDVPEAGRDGPREAG